MHKFYEFVSDSYQVLPNVVSDRRHRPKMTLSFGVDPSRKSLMFTTNSPFGLNDCAEVDPSLPLDRQEYVNDYYILDALVAILSFAGNSDILTGFYFNVIFQMVPRRHFPAGS